jgi:hypothetical protein
MRLLGFLFGVRTSRVTVPSADRDEARAAYKSGDFDRMVRAVSVETTWVDRHFLLALIVEKAYVTRKDPKRRAVCRRVGEIHLKEMPSIIPALKVHFKGYFPRIGTFERLSAVYAEDGDFEPAIEVCRQALGYGLTDNTKGGYAGRIERLQKKTIKKTPKGIYPNRSHIDRPYGKDTAPRDCDHCQPINSLDQTFEPNRRP